MQQQNFAVLMEDVLISTGNVMEKQTVMTSLMNKLVVINIG